jgi:hypothetical protein
LRHWQCSVVDPQCVDADPETIVILVPISVINYEKNFIAIGTFQQQKRGDIDIDIRDTDQKPAFQVNPDPDTDPGI